MARELNDIVKELQGAMSDVSSKLQKKNETEKAYNEASVEHKNAQEKAAALKQELDSVFNGFIQTDSRVRVSR